MTVYPPSQYKFLKFEKSKRAGKKYDAILKNKTTGREVRVPFGALGYQHYKDKALGLYSNLNHLDKKRRASYQSRHSGEGNISRKYSPGYFAYRFLW